MNWQYENGRIYNENENGELIAETTYFIKNNGEADIDHTYVNPKLRGQGIAGKMMEVVAKHLMEEGIVTSATCSYANKWLQKNRELYSDIISKDLENEAIACKIGKNH